MNAGLRRCATVIPLLLLCGCSAVGSGVPETIAVYTSPPKPALCSFTNDEGTWRIAAPASVTVDASRSPLHVACSTPDGWHAAFVLEPGVSRHDLATHLSNALRDTVLAEHVAPAYTYPGALLVGLLSPSGPEGASRPARGAVGSVEH